MAKLFANRGDPDQTPRSAASYLGLHCLPNTLLRVSRLQWVVIVLTNKVELLCLCVCVCVCVCVVCVCVCVCVCDYIC